MPTDKDDLLRLTKALLEELSKERPNTDLVWKTLEALRSLSDREGAIIPLEVFEVMGPELRMCAFDTFLGVMAQNLTEAVQPPHS